MAERSDPFQAPAWDKTDADTLRAFLKSPTGRRFIFRLRAERPDIAPANAPTAEVVALFAERARGYEEAVANVFEYLATPVEESATSRSYPDLDDDTQWPEMLQIPVLPPVPKPKPLTPEPTNG